MLVDGGIESPLQRSIETYGLPLGLILLGYGHLATNGTDPLPVGALRLALLFCAVVLIGRLGVRLGLNRTAALLAGLFCAGSPLAAYSLHAGAPVVMLIWTCLVLGILVWRLKFWRPGRLGWAVVAGAILAGTEGSMALSGVFTVGGYSPLDIPRNLLAFGAWFVLPGPLLGNPSLHRVMVPVLGAWVWAFWLLMSLHRRQMDDFGPQHLLLLALAGVAPVLAVGSRVGPAFLLLPLAMFSLFLMSFLRPSKLTDSPRVLLMAAFFLTLLASGTSVLGPG